MSGEQKYTNSKVRFLILFCVIAEDKIHFE